MQLLPVADLVPHPQNDYYFDDITGEAWNEFLRSIQTSGVIEPIIINQNKMIISGHQRIRACKELGIAEAMTETKQYDSDEQILKDLIETNIRQRGIGNPNPVKFGRCIQALERIYGFKEGRPEKLSNNFTDNPHSETDLAAQLGLTRQSLQNYKQLATMIPELQELISTGKVTPTTARAIVKRLSEDEQKKLANQLSEKDGKVSNKEIDFYINKVKELSEENNRLTKENEELEERAYKPTTIEDLTASELDGIVAALSQSPAFTNREMPQINSTELDDLRTENDFLRSQIKSANEEISELKKTQHSRPIQDADLAYDFSKAVSSLVKSFGDKLLYGDFFDNNQNNKCEEEIIKSCNLLADFCKDIIARIKTETVMFN